MSRGFRLPASHVIHTVGPIYDTNDNPEAALRNAYRYLIELSRTPFILIYKLSYSIAEFVFRFFVKLVTETVYVWQKSTTFNTLHSQLYHAGSTGMLSGYDYIFWS